MTKKLVIITPLLAAAFLSLLLYNSPRSRVSRLLGGRTYVRIISAPEGAELFQTPRFLARLTNGPMPDDNGKIEPGINLPRPAIERIQSILLDTESYSELLEDAWLAPGIILRLKRGREAIELEFPDDFAVVHIMRDGAYQKTLNCEPARRNLERAIGPFLTKRPSSWHVD
jgi:hypothetical protein